ncbi:MAG: VanZ family protein [Cellulosilyticaceae bacterium]
MKKIKYFKLTMIMTIIILIIILTPGDSVPSVGIPGIDKIVHCGMFFMWSFIYNMEYKIYTKRQSKVAMTIATGTLFAVATEVMQLFAIMRSFDVKDILADVIGIILGIIVFKIIIQYYKGGRYV